MLLLAAIAAPLAAAACWAATRLVLGLLEGRVLDRPNARSSHDRPVPRGGGLAVVAVVAPSWLVLAALGGSLATIGPVVAAALVLAAVSFLDDLRGLGAGPRLAAHATAVAAGLVLVLPAEALLLDGLLPAWADRLLVAALWLWFVNLYNFMDGIDGITGVETVALAGGLALCLAVLGGSDGALPLAAVAAGAAAGFLALNWHPARIFLGDVGSITLGYLLGFLLVWQACVEDRWWLAALLPLYYWADASSTLLARMARGEKPWRAHRCHAYQVAVQAGRSHGAVARLVALADLVLVLLALAVAAGLLGPWPALLGGAGAVAVLLCYLRRRPAGAGR